MQSLVTSWASLLQVRVGDSHLVGGYTQCLKLPEAATLDPTKHTSSLLTVVVLCFVAGGDHMIL